jgi:hypothetical protein
LEHHYLETWEVSQDGLTSLGFVLLKLFLVQAWSKEDLSPENCDERRLQNNAFDWSEVVQAFCRRISRKQIFKK